MVNMERGNAWLEKQADGVKMSIKFMGAGSDRARYDYNQFVQAIRTMEVFGLDTTRACELEADIRAYADSESRKRK